jgi:cbb3-type cytochrome oxidase cytochrome c subunit
MGPNLTQVAANPTHTESWIADHIKNPKSHNPGSRMPGYEGKISPQDLQTLSRYLATLK